MGGGFAFTGFILYGSGVISGVILTGGFRASDRLARHGRYIRMPGQHRRVRPAVKLRAGTPAWDGTDLTDTILPGTMTAIGDMTT
jgi:hypothetical protein